MDAVLKALAARDVVSVLVEGGADLAATLLRERAVDRALVVSAPLLLGADGRAMLAGLGVARLASALRLAQVTVTRLGPDVLWDGAVQYRGGAAIVRCIRCGRRSTRFSPICAPARWRCWSTSARAAKGRCASPPSA